MNPKSCLLDGVKTYAFSSKEDIINFISDQKKILIAMNAEKILCSDIPLRELINDNIGYTDGVGAVWALRKKGFDDTIKIPGCELWVDIIRRFEKEKSFYLIGSKPEVITKTVEKLRVEFPDIDILNFRDGYIKNHVIEQELIADIVLKKPDVVFVAMGSPRQEFLMKSMKQKHSALYMGLGGSFDVYTDNIKRAPLLFQKLNLEWLYRVIKQPTRISRQVIYLKFMFYLLTNKL